MQFKSISWGDGKLGPMGVEQRVCRTWSMDVPAGLAVVSDLVEVRYSLEQYIGLKEDKLSSTTVDFIRSEGNLETKRLYWFSKPKMC